MKSAASAEAFNAWHGSRKTGINVPPPPAGQLYISNEADVKQDFIHDGFLIGAPTQRCAAPTSCSCVLLLLRPASCVLLVPSAAASTLPCPATSACF